MKVGLIATHSYPIATAADPFPVPSKIPHTGDVVILDLAYGLEALGHEVTVFAPAGTRWPRLVPMRASFGKYPPSSQDCEEELWANRASELSRQDIVHDFSVTKRASERCRMVCTTLMGGPWRLTDPPRNLCVWSSSHRARVLCGATDYAGTPTPELGGPPGFPVREAHVVYGGVDTDFYCPDEHKPGSRDLWLNRWHPAKGAGQALALARTSGQFIIMVGEHPDYIEAESERVFARRLQASAPIQVSVEWLPPDPDHHTAKRALYRRARSLLYPVQFQEPFGLSMVEAMSCGTPIAKPYEYGSVPEIARDDPKCRDYVLQNFTRELFAKRYLAEYEQILDGVSW